MERVLIAGIESVVGANFAACLSERYELLGLSLSGPAPLAACETSVCRPLDADAIRGCIAGFRPTRIVFCGSGARSSWMNPISTTEAETAPETARIWATSARDFNCQFTWISSNAIFTGPWIFHGEDCQGVCPSPEASALRAAEDAVLRNCPSSLVLRTHAFGWSAASTGPGWIERLLSNLEAGTAGPFECIQHATPILASDLSEILEQALHAGLKGVFHVGGGERTNPAQFAERLADVFELPAPRTAPASSLLERPIGFGLGESSLRTSKIRQVLGTSMPLLRDGLSRLRAQRATGFCDRLSKPGRPLRDKVA